MRNMRRWYFLRCFGFWDEKMIGRGCRVKTKFGCYFVVRIRNGIIYGCHDAVVGRSEIQVRVQALLMIFLPRWWSLIEDVAW